MCPLKERPSQKFAYILLVDDGHTFEGVDDHDDDNDNNHDHHHHHHHHQIYAPYTPFCL